MWLQGLYVFKAIETALHNQPAFALHPPKPITYLENPLPLYGKTEEEVEAEKQTALDNLTKYLTSFQKSWEKKHGKGNNRPSTS